MDYKIVESVKRIDSRGFLVDFLKTEDMNPKDRALGQIYFVTFSKKNVIRGNHYHKYKKEWFIAVKGILKIILVDIETKERIEFILKGDNKKYKKIYVGNKIAHTFINLSSTAELINYSNKAYNSEKPDTYPYVLL